jgi:Flp pilus assembly protein TadD
MNDYSSLRSPSEIIKRGYTDDELSSIFALGRLFLECGNFTKAYSVLRGVAEVAPDYLPAWLGLGYICIMNGDYEQALAMTSQVLRREPSDPQAMLMTVICSLSTGDLNNAGTYLGELKDGIDGDSITEPTLIRLYSSQMVRFQSR